MPLKLACFDLDDTILNGHLHRSLEQAGIARGEAGPETVRHHVKAIGGIKNRMALQATLRDLLKKNVNIAITSYTGYPETIPVILEMIGLSKDEAARVKCASFTPPKGPNGEKTPGYGKNHHIERAIKEFGGDIKPQEVVLIDDRIDHFELAKKAGYQVVWVQGSEGDVGYLNELREMAGLGAAQEMLAYRKPILPPEEPARLGFVDRLLGWIGLQRTSIAMAR